MLNVINKHAAIGVTRTTMKKVKEKKRRGKLTQSPTQAQQAENAELMMRAKVARIEQCSMEVNAILAKYNCIIDVTMVLKSGRPPQTQASIVSQD